MPGWVLITVMSAGIVGALWLIAEAGRPGAGGEAFERARRHFVRAMELSAGAHAAPMVALAESVRTGNEVLCGVGCGGGEK